MPLDSIACVGCVFSAASDNTIYAILDLQFRYYTGLAAIKAAGSLQQPAIQPANHSLRIELSVSVSPDSKTSFVFRDPLALLGPGFLASVSFNLDSLAPFAVVSGAIVLNDDIVAIRLASDPSDSVIAPATNRLVDGSDWTQFVPRSAMADVISTSLRAAIAAVVRRDSSKYSQGNAAAAAYVTTTLPRILGITADPPFVLGTAEVVAINACPVFKIDVAVAFLAVATFVTNASSIETTYAAHKQVKVLKWLADHPRWTFHFTPTSASWLNAVEGFFSAITRRRPTRSLPFLDHLQNAIARYIDSHNSDCRPFVWTTSAKVIFEKLAQIPVPSV